MKKLFCALICLLFALPNIGCGHKDSSVPRVWLIAPGSSAAEREIRTILDACDSQIGVSFVPAEEIDMRVAAALERGEAPDVFMVYTDSLPDMAEEKQIADLSARLGVSNVKSDELLESARRACLYQGKTWGVPLFADAYMLAANRELVSAAPETAQSLKEICLALGEKGVTAFERMEPMRKSLLYEAILADKGGKILNSRKTELVFTDEQGREALDDLSEILKVGSGDDGSLGEGKAAFSIYTTAERRKAAAKYPDAEISLTPLLGLDRLQTVALAMSDDAKDGKRSFRIIEALHEAGDKLAALYEAYPAKKETEPISPDDKEVLPYIAAATASPDLCGYKALTEVYLPAAINKALKGVNAGDALDEAAEDASACIWRGKRE